MSVSFLPSIAPLAERYDAFILDLWGVIHDGQQLYPGVKECLAQLRAQGKRIVFLSNAPRRAGTVKEALLRMGITADLYEAIVTSGETAYQCLATPGNSIFTPSGNRYIYIGLEKDRRMLDGLAYEETQDPASAHFMLLSHSMYDNQPEAELAPLLQACRAAKLPTLCINPDLEVVRLGGERVYCAGVIAANYEAIGGEVVYFGKPHKAVYNACFQQLAGVERTRIIAVGDSLKTDIRGANANGVDCALVTGGILQETLGMPETAGYAERLGALCVLERAAPNYAVAAFRWC